jgi:hypothetical protein
MAETKRERERDEDREVLLKLLSGSFFFYSTPFFHSVPKSN